MASPLNTGKQAVDLAAPAVRGSRIRRDPPPKLKAISIEERNERDRRLAMIGIVAFALAICVIILAVSSYNGWSPREYTVHM